MSIYTQVAIGFGLLILGYLIRVFTDRRSKEPKPSALMQLFQNNRELDSTIAMGFTFIGFFVVVGAIASILLQSLPIPEQLWNIVNMFENFILMILSSFFTKSQMNKTGEQ